MTSNLRSLPAAMALVACLLGHASPVRAQGVELAPFGGYRFGGDFFELLAARPVDADGSPAVGFVLNVPISAGLQVEALVAHQHAHVAVPARPYPDRRRAFASPSITCRLEACRSSMTDACARS